LETQIKRTIRGDQLLQAIDYLNLLYAWNRSTDPASEDWQDWDGLKYNKRIVERLFVPLMFEEKPLCFEVYNSIAETPLARTLRAAIRNLADVVFDAEIITIELTAHLPMHAVADELRQGFRRFVYALASGEITESDLKTEAL